MFEVPAQVLGPGNRRSATALAAALHSFAVAAVLLLSPVREIWQKPPDSVTVYAPEAMRPVKAPPRAPHAARRRETEPAMPERPRAQPQAPEGQALPGGFDISTGEIFSRRGFGGDGPVASSGFDDGTGDGRGFLPNGTATAASVFAGSSGQSGSWSAPKPPQELDEPAELLPGPSPEYTAEAKRSGVTGEVWLEVELRSSGEVHVVGVLSPRIGYGLEGAAVRAANQYRCKPARRRGRAVTIIGKIKITFTLSA